MSSLYETDEQYYVTLNVALNAERWHNTCDLARQHDGNADTRHNIMGFGGDRLRFDSPTQRKLFLTELNHKLTEWINADEGAKALWRVTYEPTVELIEYPFTLDAVLWSNRPSIPEPTNGVQSTISLDDALERLDSEGFDFEIPDDDTVITTSTRMFETTIRSRMTFKRKPNND